MTGNNLMEYFPLIGASISIKVRKPENTVQYYESILVIGSTSVNGAMKFAVLLLIIKSFQMNGNYPTALISLALTFSLWPQAQHHRIRSRRTKQCRAHN